VAVGGGGVSVGGPGVEVSVGGGVSVRGTSVVGDMILTWVGVDWPHARAAIATSRDVIHAVVWCRDSMRRLLFVERDSVGGQPAAVHICGRDSATRARDKSASNHCLTSSAVMVNLNRPLLR
jgi:hypothetical protein